MKLLSRIPFTAVVVAMAITATAEARDRSGGAAVNAKQAPLPEVTVTGCVTKGSANFCWNLKAEDRTSYSFAGQPAVEGKCYTVTGTQTMGACRSGTQLSVTKIVDSASNCCDPNHPVPAKPAAAAPPP